MTNDPRGAIALGALTAMVNGDREGYLAITDQFDGGPTEAFAAMTRLAQMLVKMLGETLGISPAETLRQVGLSMAAFDEGLEPDN